MIQHYKIYYFVDIYFKLALKMYLFFIYYYNMYHFNIN